VCGGCGSGQAAALIQIWQSSAAVMSYGKPYGRALGRGPARGPSRRIIPARRVSSVQ
jgi:hypothetical protein